MLALKLYLVGMWWGGARSDSGVGGGVLCGVIVFVVFVVDICDGCGAVVGGVGEVVIAVIVVDVHVGLAGTPQPLGRRRSRVTPRLSQRSRWRPLRKIG